MTDDQTSATPQQMEIARKIQAMASEPVQSLSRKMKLLGWEPEYRAIVLEAMANEAQMEAAATLLGKPKPRGGRHA